MRTLPCLARGLALTLFAVALSGCGGAAGPASNAALLPATAVRQPAALQHAPRASGKIQHVVIIMQENRSFDNLFQGYPGADTRSYGYNSQNQKITLSQIGLETWWDLDHSSGAFFQACNGTGKIPGTQCRMNGFDKEYVGCGSSCPQNPQYAYVPHSETVPYFDMASQYVLADQMFTSNFDASSFISHQYIIAGQAASAVDYPNGAWGCTQSSQSTIGTVKVNPPRQYGSSIEACFDYTTLGDELDNAGYSWRFYAATPSDTGYIWTAYQAVRHIRFGPDWSKDIVSPETQFFHDIQNGSLANVTWITPTWANSDHAGSSSNTGPAWVATLVNAIGQSQFWNSTAIFIMWDDYGGWYDHVAPKYVDYDGVGIRVPLLIISPYAKKGRVTHVHYEHGSILKFAEDQFGLARMTASDARATSPAVEFNFSKPPRKFVVIPSQLNVKYFQSRPQDRHPPDTE